MSELHLLNSSASFYVNSGSQFNAVLFFLLIPLCDLWRITNVHFRYLINCIPGLVGLM